MHPACCLKVDPANCFEVCPVCCLKVDPANCFEVCPACCLELDPANCLEVCLAFCLEVDPVNCLEAEPANCLEVCPVCCLEVCPVCCLEVCPCEEPAPYSLGLGWLEGGEQSLAPNITREGLLISVWEHWWFQLSLSSTCRSIQEYTGVYRSTQSHLHGGQEDTPVDSIGPGEMEENWIGGVGERLMTIDTLLMLWGEKDLATLASSDGRCLDGGLPPVLPWGGTQDTNKALR